MGRQERLEKPCFLDVRLDVLFVYKLNFSLWMIHDRCYLKFIQFPSFFRVSTTSPDGCETVKRQGSVQFTLSPDFGWLPQQWSHVEILIKFLHTNSKYLLHNNIVDSCWFQYISRQSAGLPACFVDGLCLGLALALALKESPLTRFSTDSPRAFCCVFAGFLLVFC